MASEDVIELGSSDDEAEPAPKKLKPMPNAMVLIPNKLPGITITPTKSKNVAGVPKGLVGKNITVTKVKNTSANPLAIGKVKMNGRTLKTPQKQTFQSSQNLIKVNKLTVNPVNLNIIPSSRTMITNIPVKYLKKPIQVRGPKALTNLPPSITIKRTMAPPKHAALSNIINNVKKKNMTAKNKTISEVLTVELDDEEITSPTASGPQWYIRPEDQAVPEELKKQNNTEPEPSKMIEITIEDSPVKLMPNKRTHEVGAELAITIDDSPVKNTVEKNIRSSESDDEIKATEKNHHSKKKLEYPKDHGNNVGDTVEIEIEPMEANTRNGKVGETMEDPIAINESESLCDNINKEVAVVNIVKDDILVIEESPAKPEEIAEACTPKKQSLVRPQCTINIRELESIKEKSKDTEEFHPIYQNFIDMCFQLENSDDMKKIVDKKIKAYYKQVPKEYTESEQFIDMVSGKILSMKAGPEKMYLYIKDIVDELNLQRKVAKSHVLNEDAKKEEADKFLYGEDSEFDCKRQRQIRKLEKTLKKLHRAIQKLEEQEVDFDDDEDSVYLLTESEDGSSSSKSKLRPLEKDLLKRYKERMVRVHAKFCQLTNTKMPSEPRVQIDARPGRPYGPAKRLEKWINKKVPIGKPLPFPDFHDVIRCVKEANVEDNLGWNDADIMEEARDLFTRCGKKLQRRRQENEWRLAASRIAVDIDPAENSDELKKKLEQNRTLATKKETDVFNKFANKQNELKLEAEEIGDKEADESPVESEEEFANEGTSLKDKGKRKERLKRLLQDKSKKVGEEKENQPEETILDTNSNQNKVNESDKDTTDIDKKVKEDDSTDFPERGKNKIDSDKVQSVSDDSNKIESDIDELNLLQKLHSENEMNSSTLDSSDSDSPIAISDTLESSSDNKKQQSDDIISIENSSYSESEIKKDCADFAESKNTEYIPTRPVVDDSLIDANIEIESSLSGVEKTFNKSNNEEYNEAVENILLASSDEENGSNKDLSPGNNNLCVNIRDDSISIGETIVDGAELQKKKNTNEGNENSEGAVSQSIDKANENGTSLMENLVVSKDDNSDENMVKQFEIDEIKEKSDDSHNVELMEIVHAGEQNKDHEEADIVSTVTDVVTADTKVLTSDETEQDKQVSDVDNALDGTVGSTTNEVVFTTSISPGNAID